VLLARTGALGDARVAKIRSSGVARAIDLLVWSVVVIVLALEATLSLAALLVSHPLLSPPNANSRERIRSFRFAPHAPLYDGRVNAHGFHDSEWAVPKPKGRLRVAALGDSFAVGIVPYRNNVLTILEERLRVSLERDVEVCNLGTVSTSPAEYETTLADDGMALEPDMVLVCVFTGNDFMRTRTGSILNAPNWRTWAVIERGFHILRNRARRAAATQATEMGKETPDHPGAAPSLVGESKPERPPAKRPEKLSHDGYLDHVAAGYMEPLARPLPAEMERRFLRTFDVLGRIVAQARPRPVVIAVFPSEVQVRPSLLLEVSEKRGVRAETLDFDQPARRIRDAFTPLGVKVIDVRPALLAAEAANGPVYELDDSHWNKAGNKVAADAIADAIADSLRGL
jgi:hypothetical protein